MGKRTQEALVVPAPIQAFEAGFSGDPAAFTQKTLDSRFRANDAFADSSVALNVLCDSLEHK